MKAINAVAERMMNGATLELTEAEGKKRARKRGKTNRKVVDFFIMYSQFR
jgi:hypothetical protein